MTAPLSPADARRHDLDWIRVGAFGILILYHIGMFYVTWDWHVKSPHASHAIEPLMRLTSPWRLTLLFLVSGAATRFIFDRSDGPGALARSRLARLLPPLLFAVFVIVPPQTYYQLLEQEPELMPGAIAGFYASYVAGTIGLCTEDGCLITPTWNHMWFVAYLLVYSLLLCLWLVADPRLGARLSGWLDRLPGWVLLAAPAALLVMLRLTFARWFEVTHALVDDWYTHAQSFPAFLIGFAYARAPLARAAAERMRRPALLLWLAGWAGYALLMRAYPEGFDSAAPALRDATAVLYGLQEWAAILAVLGFASRHLNRGGAALRTLTRGVFPFYIAHQTAIVVAAHHLARLGLPVAAEAAMLVAATVTSCWLTYAVAQRLGPAGVLLGLSPGRQTGSSRGVRA